MKVQSNIMDTIEYKQLMWFGHVRRMVDERWPKKIWNWQPPVEGHRDRGSRESEMPWKSEDWKEEDDCAVVKLGRYIYYLTAE